MSRLVLAPMEGLADHTMRDVLTRVGGYDWCVAEFVRVGNTVLPRSSFLRVAPELRNAARTRAGTPVRLQLLGADMDLLAANAARLATLAPPAIDLNFGCPVPLVNRKRAGAALLDDPERMRRIVAAVRAAVPAALPVTAKMRLGIDDTARALDCALALEAGGAAEIVAHARTRADGYRPPARWECLAPLRAALRVPLIANGEVWTVADHRAIRAVSGCDDVMLGRGAVADPLLALRIRGLAAERAEDGGEAEWRVVFAAVEEFWTQVRAKVLPRQAPGRLKQWLGLLRRAYPRAETLHRAVRELRAAEAVDAALACAGNDG